MPMPYAAVVDMTQCTFSNYSSQRLHFSREAALQHHAQQAVFVPGCLDDFPPPRHVQSQGFGDHDMGAGFECCNGQVSVEGRRQREANDVELVTREHIGIVPVAMGYAEFFGQRVRPSHIDIGYGNQFGGGLGGEIIQMVTSVVAATDEAYGKRLYDFLQIFRLW